jgi:hypothetical protein
MTWNKLNKGTKVAAVLAFALIVIGLMVFFNVSGREVVLERAKSVSPNGRILAVLLLGAGDATVRTWYSVRLSPADAGTNPASGQEVLYLYGVQGTGDSERVHISWQDNNNLRIVHRPAASIVVHEHVLVGGQQVNVRASQQP